ncbi:MAG TPA: pitrilysin family protein [Polyangia bacterium]|nr:pitrilysin family protein [Polyangia bacterium]
MIRTTLASGLKIVLEENHAAPVVAFQAWVGVGSADEPPGSYGIAHVFEHMLFKGTARRGVGEIAQEVEASGGDINAWTSFDQTVYHLVMASRYFDTGLDILADAIQSSSFDPGELARELKVVIEEIKQGEDAPARVTTQSLFGAAYAKHPYRRPVIGFEKQVRALTRERLLEFFHKWYVLSNVTLVVVGDVEPERALRKIGQALGGAQPQPLERKSFREPEQRAPRAVAQWQNVREAHVAMGFHIPGIRHPDTGALDLLAIILGQGDSSRMNLEVRRNRQLASDIYAYSYTPRDPGLLVVGGASTPDALEDCTKAIHDEVFRVVHEEVLTQELAKARTIIESDAVYQKETVQGMARKMGFFETVAGDLDYEREYNRQIQEATPHKLREVAARYLRVENLTASILIPETDAKRGQRAVQKWKQKLPELAAKADTRAQKSWALARQDLAATGEVVRRVLRNGLRLLVKRDPSVPVLALRAVWMGGQRYEEARSAGINNMLAALLVRGTRTRSAEEIMKEVEGMAGSMGGFSGRNSFGVRGEFLSRHWERALEILADCVLGPAFADDELEKERKQVLDEIHAQEDNLTQVVFRLFAETLYKRHPYRMDVLGTPASVSALTRRRLSDYYRRHFAAGGMTLAIVGDVDPARALAKVERLFEQALAPAADAPPVEPEPQPAAPQKVWKYLTKQQAHLVVGFLGTTVSDPDRYPMEVLSTILSGQGGRLFVELRDKKGLAYRVSAFSLEGVDPGYFAVYIATSPENLEVAVAGIEHELAKVRAQPVQKGELERAKKYLVGTHEISLQRRAALASTLAFHECYGQGWDEYRRYAPSILAVSAADVQRVAQKYLDPARAVVAVVKPEEATPVAARSPRTAGAAPAPARRPL